MSQIPSILVTDGWETDQNDILQEVVIPRTVNTLQAPNKVTFMGTALNAVPSTVAALQEFSAPNMTSIGDTLFKGYTNLVSVSMTNLTSFVQKTYQGGTFVNCTKLATVYFPKLVSINEKGGNSGSNRVGTFANCTSLTTVEFPELVSIVQSTDGNNNNSDRAGTFGACTGLVSVSFPKLQSISLVSSSYAATTYSGTFRDCTALQSVYCPLLSTITYSYSGSSGHSDGAFCNCTGLTTINFPSFSLNTDAYSSCGTFLNCTSLTLVTLGSVGHPVSALGAYMFNGCTQSGLTITVYTQGGASLANEPWGAENAAVVYEEA